MARHGSDVNKQQQHQQQQLEEENKTPSNEITETPNKTIFEQML